jgi:methionyl-tRNA formyltransferase
VKIALLGCKGTTLDLLNSIILQQSFNIDLVITLPQDIAEKNKVAFYQGPEIVDLCRRYAIPVHSVQSYHLKNDQDFQYFKREAIDLLLVIGWERLIPGEILNTLGKFACGMHGSPYGLPKGRGRSPLNWSILTEHTKFITYLFKYDSFIDSGQIIGFKVFDINEFDTIATLHLKNRIAMGQLLKLYVPLIESGEVTFLAQPPEKPTYYPKRTPDDSGIDWGQNTWQIYNLIRAVAPPYPPAYCYHHDRKIFISEAYPFESGLFHCSTVPGTIVDISVSLKQFVVKTMDGSLIIKQFNGADMEDFELGDVLEGVNHGDILQQIIQRYPEDILDDQKEIRATWHPGKKYA